MENDKEKIKNLETIVQKMEQQEVETIEKNKKLIQYWKRQEVNRMRRFLHSNKKIDRDAAIAAGAKLQVHKEYYKLLTGIEYES